MDGKTTKSVLHGNATPDLLSRPTVTFPAAVHHHPLTDTKLYSLVNRGTCV